MKSFFIVFEGLSFGEEMHTKTSPKLFQFYKHLVLLLKNDCPCTFLCIQTNSNKPVQ